jgi:hypothetical protein
MGWIKPAAAGPWASWLSSKALRARMINDRLPNPAHDDTPPTSSKHPSQTFASQRRPAALLLHTLRRDKQAKLPEKQQRRSLAQRALLLALFIGAKSAKQLYGWAQPSRHANTALVTMGPPRQAHNCLCGAPSLHGWEGRRLPGLD